ncbi:MAG TPA: AraC family transcriptional regulator [Polyangiales bacterium]|nr:AraC family transcriptional regulator [Polyangiales bacterium]
MPHWSLARASASTQLMIRLAGEYGVSFEHCVRGTGLTQSELADPACEIAGTQELDVLRNILGALDPRIPFGLLAGLRYRATTHGIWGFAALSSSTLGQAMEFGLRYFDLSFSFNRVSFQLEGDEGLLIYDGSDNPEDVRATLIERDIAALITFERDLLGHMIPFTMLRLEAQAPHYAPEFERVFAVTPRFNAELNCISFDPTVLDTKLPLADEFGQRVSEQHCRALLEQRGVRSGVAGRVRGRILRNPGEFPSMKRVAAELGMSTRTLRNQLQREQTSYRALLEEVRERIAEQLLATSQMTVEQIGSRLGYADASSFVSAFKRWKGVPPRSYR